MKTFKEQVISIIAAIPKAKVASYGQIAAYAGSPRAARQVGQILRNTDESYRLPWWRVINNQGRISIRGNWYATPEVQKKLLEQEGVEVNDSFYVHMSSYRWAPSLAKIEKIIL
jgi:methylated-DNA-protein-cysteine methyltransferase-like protein